MISDYLKVNISKAKKQLNWRPKLNFDKSIKFTVLLGIKFLIVRT